MENNKKALVPVDRDAPRPSPVEEDYRQAKTYFKESVVQAAKTNAAFVTVLVLFVIRGVRYAWEGLCSLFRRKAG